VLHTAGVVQLGLALSHAYHGGDFLLLGDSWLRQETYSVLANWSALFFASFANCLI